MHQTCEKTGPKRGIHKENASCLVIPNKKVTGSREKFFPGNSVTFSKIFLNSLIDCCGCNPS